MNKKWLMCVLGLASLYGDEPVVPPEVIEQQLEDAEAQFARAKKMFNPWYTGPLLAPSAHLVPPGEFNIQPYLFITNNYAKFDQNAHAKDIPNLHQLNPVFLFQFGMTKWVDGMVTVQGLKNKQSGHSSMNWGDTSGLLGFSFLSEGPYNPALLLSVKESFPTGKYQHLDTDKNGVDATGSGAYQTTIGFNMSKVVWWLTTHPMNLRLDFAWGIPAMVHVKGYNSYGGGKDTDGKIRVGNSFAADLGYEFSFTQNWVLALDVVYNYSQETKFSGHHGLNAVGTPAVVGGPFSDQLSLAPALEYNLNSSFGFIGGVWFSVWGRNSLKFVSGVLSFTYSF